jgi:hypothetical protein
MQGFSRNSVVLLFVFVSVVSLLLAGENKHVGTWTADLDQSTYSPGPAPKSVTLTIEPAAPDGVKLVAKGQDASGNPTHIEYVAQYDGKEYPIKGLPGTETVTLKRIDDKTIEAVLKKAGTTVMTVRTVLADDGKTRTSTFKGKNEQGQAVNNTVVYRRVDSGTQRAED